jgi:hypothetical protein
MRDGNDLIVVRPDGASASTAISTTVTVLEVRGRGSENELTLSHFSARVRGAMRSMILLTHLAIDMAGQDRHYD